MLGGHNVFGAGAYAEKTFNLSSTAHSQMSWRHAGWPEAAMARALNVALSGPRSYDGEMRDFPYVNVDGSHNANPDHIDAACTALWRVWGVVLGLALLLTLF